MNSTRYDTTRQTALDGVRPRATIRASQHLHATLVAVCVCADYGSQIALPDLGRKPGNLLTMAANVHLLIRETYPLFPGVRQNARITFVLCNSTPRMTVRVFKINLTRWAWSGIPSRKHRDVANGAFFVRESPGRMA